MATMSFVSTSSEKLSRLAIKNGQMIFVADERAIYMDNNSVRTSYQQIITLETELARSSLAYPLKGFYYIRETVKLWEYNDGWTLINPDSGGGGSTTQQIVFDDYDNFPAVGDDKIIYVDGKKMYRWIDGRYQLMNTDGASNPVWVDV